MPQISESNKLTSMLVDQLETHEKIRKQDKIGLFVHSKSNLPQELEKRGYDCLVKHGSTSFPTEELKHLKIAIVRWGDRDTWRLLEVLPKHVQLYSLYSFLFHTGIDHELNKKFYQGNCGISDLVSDAGRRIPFDNKVFIYKFNT